MAIKWNIVELKGDVNGLYLEGSFEDHNGDYGNGTFIYFTAPLYGTSIDMDVYELVDSEAGGKINEDITNDMRNLYTKEISNCRSELFDVIVHALGKYDQ